MSTPESQCTPHRRFGPTEGCDHATMYCMRCIPVGIVEWCRSQDEAIVNLEAENERLKLRTLNVFDKTLGNWLNLNLEIVRLKRELALREAELEQKMTPQTKVLTDSLKVAVEALTALINDVCECAPLTPHAECKYGYAWTALDQIQGPVK